MEYGMDQMEKDKGMRLVYSKDVVSSSEDIERCKQREEDKKKSDEEILRDLKKKLPEGLAALIP